MTLVHFSNKPIAQVRTIKQPVTSSTYGKPKGLWVSDEDAEESWSWWCEAESFGGPWPWEYRVVLSPRANILTLPTALDVELFSHQYSANSGTINWGMVAEDYDGILITPYQWKLRYEMMWYYGWDCASGCIWNARAIQVLLPVQAKREV